MDRSLNYNENIFKRSAYPLVIYNTDGKLIRSNETFLRLTGYTEDELFNHNNPALHPFTPSDQFKNLIKETIEHKKDTYVTVKKIVRENKSVLFCEETGHIIYDDKNNVQCIYAELLDKTDESLIMERVQFHKELGIELNRINNPDQLFRTVLSSFLILEGIEAGGFYTCTENGDFHLKYDINLPEDFVNEVTFFSSTSPQAEIVRQGQVQYFDYEEMFRNKKYRHSSGKLIKYLIVIPLIIEDKVLGTVNLASYSTKSLFYFTKHIIETSANLISSALIRIIKNEEIQLSNQNMRNIINSLPFSVVILDSENRIQKVNQFALKQLGYDDEHEMLGKVCRKVFCPGTAGQCFFADLKENDVNIKEFRVIKKDGTELPVIKSVAKVMIDNKEMLLESFIDISERLIIEEELKESEDKFRQIFDTIYDSLIIFDLDANIIEVNKAACEQYEYSREELLTLSPLQLIHPDYHPVYEDLVKDVIEKGDCAGETIDIKKSGVCFNTLMTGSLITMHDISYILVAIKDISEIKKQQQIVYEAKQFNDLIFENSPYGILTYNEKGDCTSANFAAAKIVGAEIEKVLQQNFHQIESWKKSGLYDAALKALKENTTVNKTLYVTTTYNNKVVLYCSLTPFYLNSKQQLLLIVSDETEKVRAKEQRDHFFNTTIALLCTANMDGFFLDLNPSWHKLLGYTDDELKSRPFIDFVHPDDVKTTMDEMALLLNGKTVLNFTNRYRKKNGDFCWLNWISVPSNDIIYASAIDITELKNKEAALKDAIIRAENANRAKSEFLANMSHEIRTPLNAVIGFSELLLSVTDNPKSKQFIDSIKTAGKSLLTLINDILDLSKIEANKLEPNYSAFHIDVLLKEIKQIFRQKIKDKEINFIIEQNFEEKITVFLDEIRIRQILLNLIGNAIKFTEKGYVKVLVKIDNRDSNGRADLQMIIEDTGIGIPEEDQSAIFESFRQMQGQSNSKYGGTGLGLTISKKLIEIMGGTIQLESRSHEGSRFIVSFNNVEISEITMNRIVDKDLTEKYHFKENSVLIVDDVRSNREVMYEALTNVGLKVLQAGNGQEAIIISNEAKPGCIIMDIRMPGMDGNKAAEIIRNKEENKTIPIIALTASIKPEEDQNKEIFTCYLLKPVNLNQLYKELAKYLELEVITELPSDSSETITEQAKLSQDGFDFLIKNVKPVIEKMMGGINIQELTDIGELMREEGIKKNDSYLITTSEKLIDYIGSFDTEGINTIINLIMEDIT